MPHEAPYGKSEAQALRDHARSVSETLIAEGSKLSILLPSVL